MRVRHAALGIAALVAASGASATAGCAQSLAPMRGEVSSFTDTFAVRVAPGKPRTFAPSRKSRSPRSDEPG